jgi:peptidoglycan hydrolase CwlO-like protein
MPEERVAKRALGLLPWIFALTTVLAVVIGFRAPAPSISGVTQEDQVLRVLRAREADIRAQIEKNLSETNSILKRITEELEKEDYDAEKLLAAVTEKRKELRALRDELQKVLVQIEVINPKRGL